MTPQLLWKQAGNVLVSQSQFPRVFSPFSCLVAYTDRFPAPRYRHSLVRAFACRHAPTRVRTTVSVRCRALCAR